MAALEIIQSPSSESKEIQELHRLFLLNLAPALVGPDQKAVPIPESIYNILVQVVNYLAQGKGVSVVPIMQELTTQQAANLLGVSRPFLVKLLDGGSISFHRTGAHRRIYLKDVLEYQAKRDTERNKILTDLAQKAVEEGRYDQVYSPEDCE